MNVHTCTICLESCDRAFCRLTACGHRFHSKCLQPWLVQHANCPLCRTTDIACQHGPLRCHPKSTLTVVIELQLIQLQSMGYELATARDEEIMHQLSIQSLVDAIHQYEQRLDALHTVLNHITIVDVRDFR